MGKYIQGPNTGKAEMLVEKYGAREVGSSAAGLAVKNDEGVVCVVDNGFFEVAAYCYSLREFNDFNEPGDTRLKTWLIMKKETIEELAV